MRKKALTKDERKINITQWFASRLQVRNESMASLAEIAGGQGMSPSTHLRKILESMVMDGTLIAGVLERPGRWTGRGYMLLEGTYELPTKKRATVINYSVRGLKITERLLL
jgi:hypothetical protein